MKKRMTATQILFIIMLLLMSCGKADSQKEVIVKEEPLNTEIEAEIQSDSEETTLGDTAILAPSKEQVLNMREHVLNGMTEEEKNRLITNIKDLNNTWELLYFDNILNRLRDTNDLYWGYVDEKGDFVIGFATDDEGKASEVLGYNRFNYETFIDLIRDMQSSVKNEQLNDQLDILCEEMLLAHETHDVQHVEYLFYILHDMDYFLLRYGIDDVGPYVKDTSFISTYYGSLVMYE